MNKITVKVTKPIPGIADKIMDWVWGDRRVDMRSRIPEHDCTASPNDGCEVCDEYLSGGDLTKKQ